MLYWMLDNVWVGTYLDWSWTWFRICLGCVPRGWTVFALLVVCGSPAAFATPADMETASLYTVADISPRFPFPSPLWWGFVSGCIRETVGCQETSLSGNGVWGSSGIHSFHGTHGSIPDHLEPNLGQWSHIRLVSVREVLIWSEIEGAIGAWLVMLRSHCDYHGFLWCHLPL